MKYWLPVVLWAAVIFGASTDAMSARRTSRIIGPVLRWLIPDISEAAIRRVQLGVRKTAHVLEYAILAALLWRAVRRPVAGEKRPWDWRQAGWVILAATCYAVTDEWHQSWVPSRGGHWADALLDGAGAGLGLLVIWGWGRWRGRW